MQCTETDPEATKSECGQIRKNAPDARADIPQHGAAAQLTLQPIYPDIPTL